jgi:polyribonucleotide nucleotidyltransferase
LSRSIRFSTYLTRSKLNQVLDSSRKPFSTENLTPSKFLCSSTFRIDGVDLGICDSRMGHLSECSSVATAGDSIVHVSVNSAKPAEEPKEDFLPLTVDYRSRLYAFGKIPMTTNKKERHGGDDEILVSRFIDRAIRPLFPKGYTQEVQLIATAHSADGIHDPTVLSVNAASLALLCSSQPWNGPVGCVRVGLVDGKLKVNPTVTEMQKSSLDLLYAGTATRALMIEAGGEQTGETIVKDALTLAHSSVAKIVKAQEEFVSQKKLTNNLTKKVPLIINEKLYKFLKGKFYNDALMLYSSSENLDLLKKDTRSELEGKFRAKLLENIEKEEFYKNENFLIKSMVVDKIIHEAFRQSVLMKLPNTGKRDFLDFLNVRRCDGRAVDEIRQIQSTTNVLPVAHGSSYFSRGDTHVLCSTTLGSYDDSKEFYALNGSKDLQKAYFMLHYDFPPYCTGELGLVHQVNRRMIGHGALAEKAIKYVIPKFEDFPYTIRVFSECTSSNGSSSMASTCGATLALRSAGVPIKADVAGISIGLFTDSSFSISSSGETNGKYCLLTDILGSEDHHGDMDFKVAGTSAGITAIQLDVKLEGGVPLPILFEAMDKAKVARLDILESVKNPQQLSTPLVSSSSTATTVSPHEKQLPGAALIKVDPNRLSHVIGPGGEMVETIKKFYNVTVNVLDHSDGPSLENYVYVYGEKKKDVLEAKTLIEDIGVLVNVNDIFETTSIVDIKDYGLILKVNRSQLGLLHISELTHDPTILSKPLKSLFKKGQMIPSKVTSVDKLTGLIKLSRKALLNDKTSEAGDGSCSIVDKELLAIIGSEPIKETENAIDTTDIKPPMKWQKAFFK